METLNIILGIFASGLSIGTFIFSKKVSNQNKRIENYLKSELNIDLDKSKKEQFTNKKATSGNNGTSIIGNNNKFKGGN